MSSETFRRIDPVYAQSLEVLLNPQSAFEISTLVDLTSSFSTKSLIRQYHLLWRDISSIYGQSALPIVSIQPDPDKTAPSLQSQYRLYFSGPAQNEKAPVIVRLAQLCVDTPPVGTSHMVMNMRKETLYDGAYPGLQSAYARLGTFEGSDSESIQRAFSLLNIRRDEFAEDALAATPVRLEDFFALKKIFPLIREEFMKEYYDSKI